MGRWLTTAGLLGVALGLVLAAAAAATDSSSGQASGGFERYGRGPILPVPRPTGIDAAKAALGRLLFHDTRLSLDDSVSCASCHNLDTYGVDQRVLSVGVKGKVGAVNAPTVYNSALNGSQFWDGRADSLERQVPGPVHNPVEMASDWGQVIGKLQQDAQYRQQFDDIFDDGMTSANIENAIAEFERTLNLVDAPFDRYLRGEEDAITDEQKRGYAAFRAYGCVSCHQGANVGGNLFERMGLFGDYFAERGGLNEADRGRFNVTGDEEDLYFFKVPSLRLAAYTAPYFHDGSVNTLESAIEVMGRFQIGRRIPNEEVRQIAAFIRSLAGPIPEVRR